MVGIRSRTQLTPEILDKRRSLISIGSFSVGTNQVALDCARRLGLPVFKNDCGNHHAVPPRLPPSQWRPIPAVRRRGRWAQPRCTPRSLASSAMATSTPSLPCLPKQSACASSSTTAPTSSSMATYTADRKPRWIARQVRRCLAARARHARTRGMITEREIRAMQ
jgi:D-isomer specific 2-hydroxyacid dehydrogenase, catalytic domain